MCDVSLSTKSMTSERQRSCDAAFDKEKYRSDCWRRRQMVVASSRRNVATTADTLDSCGVGAVSGREKWEKEEEKTVEKKIVKEAAEGKNSIAPQCRTWNIQSEPPDRTLTAKRKSSEDDVMYEDDVVTSLDGRETVRGMSSSRVPTLKGLQTGHLNEKSDDKFVWYSAPPAKVFRCDELNGGIIDGNICGDKRGNGGVREVRDAGRKWGAGELAGGTPNENVQKKSVLPPNQRREKTNTGGVNIGGKNSRNSNKCCNSGNNSSSSSSNSGSNNSSVSVNIIHNIDAAGIMNRTQSEIKLTFISSTVNPASSSSHSCSSSSSSSSSNQPVTSTNHDEHTSHGTHLDSPSCDTSPPSCPDDSEADQRCFVTSSTEVIASEAPAQDFDCGAALAMDDFDELTAFLDKIGGSEEEEEDGGGGEGETDGRVGSDVKTEGDLRADCEVAVDSELVAVVGGGTGCGTMESGTLAAGYGIYQSQSSDLFPLSHRAGCNGVQKYADTTPPMKITQSPMSTVDDETVPVRSGVSAGRAGGTDLLPAGPARGTDLLPSGPARIPMLVDTTGPAAETLKAMAARHQSHVAAAQQAQYGYVEKSSLFDYDGSFGSGMDYNNGTSPYSSQYFYTRVYGADMRSPGISRTGVYSNGYAGLGLNPYSSFNGNCRMQIQSDQMANQQRAFFRTSIGSPSSSSSSSSSLHSTKPLSHYPMTSPTESSLQQLQHQVQSHFGTQAAALPRFGQCQPGQPVCGSAAYAKSPGTFDQQPPSLSEPRIAPTFSAATEQSQRDQRQTLDDVRLVQRRMLSSQNLTPQHQMTSSSSQRMTSQASRVVSGTYKQIPGGRDVAEKVISPHQQMKLGTMQQQTLNCSMGDLTPRQGLVTSFSMSQQQSIMLAMNGSDAQFSKTRIQMSQSQQQEMSQQINATQNDQPYSDNSIQQRQQYAQQVQSQSLSTNFNALMQQNQSYSHWGGPTGSPLVCGKSKISGGDILSNINGGQNDFDARNQSLTLELNGPSASIPLFNNNSTNNNNNSNTNNNNNNNSNYVSPAAVTVKNQLPLVVTSSQGSSSSSSSSSNGPCSFYQTAQRQNIAANGLLTVRAATANGAERCPAAIFNSPYSRPFNAPRRISPQPEVDWLRYNGEQQRWPSSIGIQSISPVRPPPPAYPSVVQNICGENKMAGTERQNINGSCPRTNNSGRVLGVGINNVLKPQQSFVSDRQFLMPTVCRKTVEETGDDVKEFYQRTNIDFNR